MTNEEEAGTRVVLEKGEFNEKLNTHHIVASSDSAERPLSAALVLAFALCSHSFLIFFHTRLFYQPVHLFPAFLPLSIFILEELSKVTGIHLVDIPLRPIFSRSFISAFKAMPCYPLRELSQ